MLILVVDPKKRPYTKEINGTLEEMQELVGGLIQVVYPFEERVALVCNDEGKLMGLPMNRALRGERGQPYDIISGTFFLCGAPEDCDDFVGLTQEQVERYERKFHAPEAFFKMKHGDILCVPMEGPSQ